MEIQVKVGQALYEPDPRRSSYREYEVVSIGRKWIQLKPDARCDFDLWRDCGGYAPRKLYTSVEEYENGRSLAAAWSDLCRDLQRAPRPAAMTLDEIDSIREKLGLKVFERRAKP